MKPIKICIISLRSLPYLTANIILKRYRRRRINLYNLACCLSQKKNMSVQVVVDDFGQPADIKRRY